MSPEWIEERLEELRAHHIETVKIAMFEELQDALIEYMVKKKCKKPGACQELLEETRRQVRTSRPYGGFKALPYDNVATRLRNNLPMNLPTQEDSSYRKW